MASGHPKGFWRRTRNGLHSQDQVMAVDVQLEDHIREIEAWRAATCGVLRTRPHARRSWRSWRNSTTRRLAPTPTATPGRSW